MDVVTLPSVIPAFREQQDLSSPDGFILANTQAMLLHRLRNECIIPVFAKDNESTISHSQYIEAVAEAVHQAYSGETILEPAIRVSHSIKGRIPEAMGKPANQLFEHEKTLYYERMAFLIEIPSIRESIAGNSLSLIVGGVRAYNHENLYGKKTEERFKVFAGFKNKVCTNLCVSTDGFKGEIRARTPRELAAQVFLMLMDYNSQSQLEELRQLPYYDLSESQFAQIVGRMRMYPYLPAEAKKGIPELMLGDAQINSVVKEYYQDEHFCRERNGSIDLWRFYNLLTGANKSSYIDTFTDRLVNIHGFTRRLQDALSTNQPMWYLN